MSTQRIIETTLHTGVSLKHQIPTVSMHDCGDECIDLQIGEKCFVEILQYKNGQTHFTYFKSVDGKLFTYVCMRKTGTVHYMGVAKWVDKNRFINFINKQNVHN